MRNRFTRSCNTIYCPKIVVTHNCFGTKYLIFAVIYVCNTYLGCLDQRFCNTRLFHITLLFFLTLTAARSVFHHVTIMWCTFFHFCSKRVLVIRQGICLCFWDWVSFLLQDVHADIPADRTSGVDRFRITKHIFRNSYVAVPNRGIHSMQPAEMRLLFGDAVKRVCVFGNVGCSCNTFLMLFGNCVELWTS